MDSGVAERTKELDAKDDKCKMHDFFKSDDENMSVASGSTQQSRASRAQANAAKRARKKKQRRRTNASARDAGTPTTIEA